MRRKIFCRNPLPGILFFILKYLARFHCSACIKYFTQFLRRCIIVFMPPVRYLFFMIGTAPFSFEELKLMERYSDLSLRLDSLPIKKKRDGKASCPQAFRRTVHNNLNTQAWFSRIRYPISFWISKQASRVPDYAPGISFLSRKSGY